MNLLAYREKHKLTQVQLSLKIKYSTRHIRRWEKGANMRPSVIQWIKDKVENA